VGWEEGRVCLIHVLFLYVFAGCVSLYFVSNRYIGYSQLLISTLSVNVDNSVVLIIMTAVNAGFRLI
jgi:hypothetical protein